ncbi:TPA: NAD(P)-binding domain-containing protein [Staphylococcus aureus]|nr:NAD(P)-binding domain-containing protein [Staphylococcus aureus]HDG8586573.1 NAD(P)-binding domain-containing protein [Staphylococcus aureus]HDZ3299426.1 NAD(P)-binding domain-containing protein [Staphylococcus aureus]HDZ3315747.1 NAD(P)-binding domain-containing protein [Staphylococcus aureus]HDZ3340406.1 NAD(P)-binding domain-containing protein [Staphylococcus aureus]
MKFGIIGSGEIGATLSHKLYDNGHQVKVADVRSIKHLEGKNIGGQAVELENISEDIDVLILSIPIDVMPKVRHIISNMSENIIIVDTSNYYPFRNNKIEAIENGIPESVWVSQQLGKSVIKAFNNQLAYTLANKGAPKDSENRIAMAVAGNDIKEKEIIMNIVSEVGFDTIDSGELKDSWRQQPGTPAYCTELNKEDLKAALENANKNEAPYRRDKVIENISSEFTSEDIVKLNRKIYNT